MAQPRLCQSMTRRARRMRATASATARAGMVGGFCTRIALPGWTVAESVASRDAAARTAFHDATPRKTGRDSTCRRATAGAWSTCTVTRGSVAISGGSSVSSYPTRCTSAPLSASARAWYSMRGLRPRSPSTTTVTRKRGMEKAGVIAHPPRTLHGRRIAIAGGGTAGHVQPALAVAEAYRAALPDVDILFLGTPDGAESRLVPAHGFRIATVAAAPFFSVGTAPQRDRADGGCRAGASGAARRGQRAGPRLRQLRLGGRAPGRERWACAR